ncbi:MAG: c-type cytochrome, partial [Cyclobacteriaceae bacterium]|nr:c-type cytochrome [Cyclobacteriaceae bacterium]
QPSEPEALQLAAMSQLRTAKMPGVATNLISLWPTLGPKARAIASDILLYDSHNHDQLLTAMENGKIQLGEMNLHLERRRELLFSEKASIRQRAEALFSDAGVVKREEAIAQMQPALSLKGNAITGQDTFESLCASCHRLESQGKEVGPDLTDVFNKSSISLMHDILDPNAAVDTKYINHIVRSEDGNTYTGIVARETDREVIIKMIGGLEKTIPRNQIKEFSGTGRSMMPEGLEASMDHQQMADLLTYLQQYR